MAADLSGRRPRRLDLLGLVTMATGVVTLLLALSQGNREGWSSQYIVWLFVIAAVSLVLFVLIELWVRDPLVDLRLYRNATYSMATLVGVLLGFAMFGSSLLLPLFLEDFLEYTALQAALLMLPGVVLTGVISPLVGKWCDQYQSPPLPGARLSPGGGVHLLVCLHGGANRGEDAGLGADRARWTRVCLPAPRHAGVAHAGARGDQRRLGFTEYHAANCRDGRHCPGWGAPRTLALCAPPHWR